MLGASPWQSKTHGIHQDLSNPLGMGAESGEKLHQVVCYREENETGVLDF